MRKAPILIPRRTLDSLVVESIPNITVAAANVTLELISCSPLHAKSTDRLTYKVKAVVTYPGGGGSVYTVSTSPKKAVARAAYMAAAEKLREGYGIRVTGQGIAELVRPDK